MPRPLLHILLASALLTSACSDRQTLDETGTTIVTLPGGREIKAEVLTHPQDMLRGMMFRDSLAPDRGMLFIHGAPGKYSYWMYQVRIPLDIIWMAPNHGIVEISADTPPCPSKSASACPSFGGKETAVYVLELAGGSVRKLNLKVGDTISF